MEVGRASDQWIDRKTGGVGDDVEPDDLNALAEGHGCLKAIDEWIDANPGGDAARQQVKSVGGQAQALLEKLILQEVTDATAAVNELMQLGMEVQKSAR